MMARGWWVFVLRGVVAILFGILAFLLPGLGLAVIIGILAAWMLLDGIGTLYQAVKGPPERHGFWFWLDGIVSIIAAAALLFMPLASALALVLVAGVWSIMIGVFRLVLAFRLASVLMGLLGALNIFIGAWLIAQPGPGLLALIWVVGLEAIIAGVLMIGLGWRLRRVHHDPHGAG
ncbi:MAG: DUF308 domain-containing protein [Acetobacteraceae bacterium]|nr:DUF308 domain-containing protein [Acetobacteraceae bacterium]